MAVDTQAPPSPLAVAHRLGLQAIETSTRAATAFHIVNHTVRLLPYHRAALWDLRGRTPSLLAVSGQQTIAARAPALKAWRRVIKKSPPDASHPILTEEEFAKSEDWEVLFANRRVPSLLWLPLQARGRCLAGLWIEPAPGGTWSQEQLAALGLLCETYAISLAPRMRSGWRRHVGQAVRWGSWLAVLVALVLTMLWVRVPLNVTAECEIVPEDPLLMTAPLSGVIDKVMVEPGQHVKAGTPLFSFEEEELRYQHEVADREVQVIQAQLDQARLRALHGGDADNGTEAILVHRLRQEQMRLALTQERLSRLVVLSPADGVIQMNNPRAWEGRPVQLGERVLEIIKPEETMVHLWIPEESDLKLNALPAVQIYLHSDPATDYAAHVRFAANTVTVTPEGGSGFLAEADWTHKPPAARIGARGVAMLGGEEVPLGYWLTRRLYDQCREWAGL